MGEFIDGQHFVMEASLHQLSEGTIIRCLPRQYAQVYESHGAKVLLHAPRHDEGKGYFGTAIIDGFEPDPDGRWLFIALRRIQLFAQSVSTLDNGTPRENAPRDAMGKLAFSFYANGLRSIAKAV